MESHTTGDDGESLHRRQAERCGCSAGLLLRLMDQEATAKSREELSRPAVQIISSAEMMTLRTGASIS